MDAPEKEYAGHKGMHACLYKWWNDWMPQQKENDQFYFKYMHDHSRLGHWACVLSD